jgi:hypothetical protein
MWTREQLLTEARPLAVEIVAAKKRATGSKMAAYDRAAEAIGVSASWLRKLIGRQPDVRIDGHELLNLWAVHRRVCGAYERACERVEAAAERERRRTAALEEEFDAALAGGVLVAARAGGARRRGVEA